MFALALTVSEMLKFQMFNFKSRSRSLGVTFEMVMTNIKIYKSFSLHYCASCHSFRDIIIYNV